MEVEEREVVVSDLALRSLEDIYEYGIETFTINAANIFIEELFIKIVQLSMRYDLYPECRYLTTKTKSYRNLIFGSYLVIYRITATKIQVLNVLHSSRSIATIKASKKVTI
jgi:toxin ParE1/3/4